MHAMLLIQMEASVYLLLLVSSSLKNADVVYAAGIQIIYILHAYALTCTFFIAQGVEVKAYMRGNFQVDC